MKLGSGIKVFIGVIIVAAIVFGIKAVGIYQKAFVPSVNLGGKEFMYVYIPSGFTPDSVFHYFYKLDIVTNINDLDWVIEEKKYNQVKPGRYKITHGMTNNQLVNMLRAGNQAPVNVVLAGRMYSVNDIAGKAARYIEPDSLLLLQALQNPALIDSLGYNKFTFLGMFIPNTYQFFWNTTAEQFVTRMYTENQRFWNKKRAAKADKTGMSINEIVTLASIVDEETIMKDEMNKIAGVYINRLNKGMRLQADPTIKFAINDFTIKRVLHKHLVFNSPYNTYLNAGLPPGPISVPSIHAIDAVLNYDKHNYLYFCAKDDFSGYHNFARTLTQHNKNAHKYRKALNKRRIYN